MYVIQICSVFGNRAYHQALERNQKQWEHSIIFEVSTEEVKKRWPIAGTGLCLAANSVSGNTAWLLESSSI